jgi:hypothetical protein
MCEDFFPKFGDKITGCLITTMAEALKRYIIAEGDYFEGDAGQ